MHAIMIQYMAKVFCTIDVIQYKNRKSCRKYCTFMNQCCTLINAIDNKRQAFYAIDIYKHISLLLLLSSRCRVLYLDVSFATCRITEQTLCMDSEFVSSCMPCPFSKLSSVKTGMANGTSHHQTLRY